jgi:hypothetical protein
MGRIGSFLIQCVFVIVVVVNRISSFFRHSASLYTARFAKLHELTDLLTDTFDETSLLLGISRFNHVLRIRPTKNRTQLRIIKM